jgi:hypothetical protein
VTDADREGFAAEMMRLQEVYERNVTEGMAEAYFEALGDYALREVRVATRIAIRSSRFFPRPSELIDTMNRERRTAREARALASRELPMLVMSPEERAREEAAAREARGMFKDLVMRIAAKFTRERRPVLALVPVAPEEQARHTARKQAEVQRMRDAGLL